MKTYSELLDTKLYLDVILELIPDGNPNCRFGINENIIDYQLLEPIIVDYQLELLTPFSIMIELYNKSDNNTGIIINRLSVDNIEIMPRFNYLANYYNEHNTNNPTNYLGVNGKWVLTVDRPFYQWLHQAQNQGWLIG